MISTNTSVDLVLPVGTHDHSQGMLAAPIVLVEYLGLDVNQRHQQHYYFRHLYLV